MLRSCPRIIISFERIFTDLLFLAISFPLVVTFQPFATTPPLITLGYPLHDIPRGVTLLHIRLCGVDGHPLEPVALAEKAEVIALQGSRHAAFGDRGVVIYSQCWRALHHVQKLVVLRKVEAGKVGGDVVDRARDLPCGRANKRHVGLATVRDEDGVVACRVQGPAVGLLVGDRLLVRHGQFKAGREVDDSNTEGRVGHHGARVTTEEVDAKGDREVGRAVNNRLG